MKTFGDLLREYRGNTRTSRGRWLSQMKFADLVAEKTGLDSLSGAAVSYWESGTYQINKDDRFLLVGIIDVLHSYGGIQSLAEANTLLYAGNYRLLDGAECEQINSEWSTVLTEMSLPAPTVDGLDIPPPDYTRLFGTDRVIEALYGLLTLAEAPWVVAIVGLGGLGKTAVADALARKVYDAGDFERVIWLSIDTQEDDATVTLESFLTLLGSQLFSEAFAQRAVNQQRLQIRHILKEKRHLIVVDNLERQEDMVHWLNQLNDFIYPSKFLLTSRHKPPLGSNVHVFPLEALSAEDAVALLRYRAKVIGASKLGEVSDALLEEMYMVIGGHPLALRMIPSLVQLYGWSEIREGWQQGHEAAVTDIYEAIYQKLWHHLGATEKQLLQILMLSTQSGITRQHLQAVSGMAKRDLATAVSQLVNYALIEVHGTLQEPRFRIHRLTHQFLSSQRATDPHWHEAQFGHFVVGNLAYWQAWLSQFSDRDWHLVDGERTNIFRAAETTAQLQNLPDDLNEMVVAFADKLYQYVKRRGFADEWKPLLNALCERFHEMPLIQCRLLNQLGYLYGMTQQHQLAVAVHQKALGIAHHLEADEEVGRSYLNLGRDYWRQRQFEEAEKQTEMAFAVFEHQAGCINERGLTYNLLGLIAREQGDWYRAETYFAKATEIWRQTDEPAELATTLNNMAIALIHQRSFENALSCYREARKALKQTANKVGEIVLDISEGTLYFNLGQYGKARTIFERLDLLFLKQSGLIHIEATVLNNLGLVAIEMGDYKLAQSYLEACLQIREEMENDVRKANVLVSLVKVYMEQERRQAATEALGVAKALLKPYTNDWEAKYVCEELEKQIERWGLEGTE